MNQRLRLEGQSKIARQRGSESSE